LCGSIFLACTGQVPIGGGGGGAEAGSGPGATKTGDSGDGDSSAIEASVDQVASSEGGPGEAGANDASCAGWAERLTAPIVPPWQVAGSEGLAPFGGGGPGSPGKACAPYTVTAIDHATCDPDWNLDAGVCPGDASCNTACWAGGDLCASYDPASGDVDTIAVNPGYSGSMTMNLAQNACGKNDSEIFTIEVGSPIEENNQPFLATADSLPDLFDAMTYTFDAADGVSWPGCSPGGCIAAGACSYVPGPGGSATFTVPPVGVTLELQTTGGVTAVTGMLLDVRCP
jgi:hypothetical protein